MGRLCPRALYHDISVRLGFSVNSRLHSSSNAAALVAGCVDLREDADDTADGQVSDFVGVI